eukprot:NODE_267_length_11298_cov_1.167872.p5 type:complete len:304 gc:universal NODE_267_length_11298_cov_1.167872:10812-9901(-)
MVFEMILKSNLPKPVLLCQYERNGKKRELRMPLRVLIFSPDQEIEILIVKCTLDLLRRHTILRDFKFKQIMEIVDIICNVHLSLDYNKLPDKYIECLKNDMEKNFKPVDDDIYDKRQDFVAKEENEWDLEDIKTTKPLSNNFQTRPAFDKHKSNQPDLNNIKINERILPSMSHIYKIDEINEIALDINKSNSASELTKTEDINDLLQLIEEPKDYAHDFENDESSNASEIIEEEIKSTSTSSAKSPTIQTRSASFVHAPVRNIEVTEINLTSEPMHNDAMKLTNSIHTLTKRLSTPGGYVVPN